MNVLEVFIKQGGKSLLKQYWRGGAFFTALAEFLLLGKSRTALEILRLSAEFKIKNKLEKQYCYKLEEFDKQYDEQIQHEISKKVWVCWFEGIENAPKIVQRCYFSLQNNITDREIVLLSYENMYDYVAFPEYIQNKIDQGIIEGAHLSDLLRLELLTKYGGTWIDSTVLCTSSKIPPFMMESELFLYQCMKPGRDGHSTTVSNWFITSYSHNKILEAVKYLLYSYWEKNDELIDYFIFHDFFQIVIEKYFSEWERVIPVDNSTPHVILLRLFHQYNDKLWNAVTGITPFHKLTYKFNEDDIEKTNTYYEKIMNEDSIRVTESDGHDLP